MPGWKTAVSLIAASVTLMGLSAPALAGARESGVREGVEEHPCPAPVPAGTTCGYLLVPERRDAYRSDTVRVGFAVRRVDSPAGPPVVFTNGGPGMSSIQLTGTIAAIAPDRDVVVMEQRGGAFSEPRLECPEIVTGALKELTSTGPAKGDMALAARACRARLTSDLRGFRTQEIAADVVELRRTLGYDKWSLFGVGYSTRMMLLAAAMDPEGTASVVLDSYLPESYAVYDEAPAALRSMADRLGVAGRYDQMVRNLNAEPVSLATRDPLTRARVEVSLSGDDVATLLAESVSDPEVLPILPALIDGLADGQTDLLSPLVDAAAATMTGREWGLYYSVQCQDEWPSNQIRSRALFTVFNDATTCAEWRLPASGEEGALTQSPVLVLAGQYDPAIPAEKVRTASEKLPAARFQEFAGVGYGVFEVSDCGRKTIGAFLADPAAPAPCDPAKAPRALVEPGDVHLTPAGYTTTGFPWAVAPLGAFALLSLFQVAGGAITVRRGGLLTLLAGLAGAAFCAVAAWSVWAVSDRVAFTVGIPPIIFWASLLPIAATCLSVVAAFRDRAPGVLILPAATGLIFTAWLIGWVL